MASEDFFHAQPGELYHFGEIEQRLAPAGAAPYYVAAAAAGGHPHRTIHAERLAGITLQDAIAQDFLPAILAFADTRVSRVATDVGGAFHGYLVVLEDFILMQGGLPAGSDLNSFGTLEEFREYAFEVLPALRVPKEAFRVRALPIRVANIRSMMDEVTRKALLCSAALKEIVSSQPVLGRALHDIPRHETGR